MTDHDALYRAILAHPGDDTPRLVYADWLQENDRPEEAEFIRLGCRLEAESPDHPDYVEWAVRRHELRIWLGTHCPGPKLSLTGGLKVPSGGDWWWTNRRGFPRSLEFDGKDRTGLRPIRELVTGLEKAFTLLPTRWLIVHSITASQLAQLLREPVVESLDGLTVTLIRSGEEPDDVARVVATSPRLRNLRRACLDCEIGEVGAQALAESDSFGCLEMLAILGGLLSPAAVRSLTSAAWFRNLRDLRFEPVSPALFEQLCRSDPFPRLEELNLEGSQAPFPPELLRRLARSKSFPRLVQFSVDRGAFGVGAGAALSDPAAFRLASLRLDHSAMGNREAGELNNAPWLESLNELSLVGNRLGPAGVKALAGSEKLSGLKLLDLENNSVGAGGLRAIARNRALRGLIMLELGCRSDENGSLTPDHLHEFLLKLDMPELRNLSLSGRPVGGKAARLLADEKFRALTQLSLRGCRLTDAAVAAMLTAPALQNLIELDLAENHLKDGVAPLTDRHTLPRLAKCHLKGNRIPEALAKKLRRRPGVEL